MKTNHFYMDLMVPNQPNKDVVFNEALLTIDNFLSMTITGLLPDAPEEIANGSKYIITGGNHRNSLCYKTQNSRAIEYIYPHHGALLFSLESRSFMLFTYDNWEEIQINAEGRPAFPLSGFGAELPTVDANFTGTNSEFVAMENKPFFYLYLNEPSTMNFDQVNLSEITIIIKQCHNASHNITWPYNILWENGTPHNMTAIPNATDIIKLYRLPETAHFLGKIIAQNLQF